MTDLDLEAIRKRVDALTPQWRYDSYRTVFSAALVSGAPDDPEHYVVCRSVDPKKPEQNDDMDFIADAPDIVRDLLVRIEELEARLAKREARLEIDHCFESTPYAEMVRVEIPDDERDDFPDGIEARDCTIQLMEEHIDDLTHERDEAREALGGMLRHSCVADAGADMKDEEDHEFERAARAALPKESE